MHDKALGNRYPKGLEGTVKHYCVLYKGQETSYSRRNYAGNGKDFNAKSKPKNIMSVVEHYARIIRLL